MSVTNNDRAEWARAAVDVFAEKTGLDKSGDDLDTMIGDLIADIMHLCERDGLDFEQVLHRGKMYFEEERNDEDARISGEKNRLSMG